MIKVDGVAHSEPTSASHQKLLAVVAPVGRYAVGLDGEGDDPSHDGGVGVNVAAGADSLDNGGLVIVQTACRDPQTKRDRVLTRDAAAVPKLTHDPLDGHVERDRLHSVIEQAHGGLD